MTVSWSARPAVSRASTVSWPPTRSATVSARPSGIARAARTAALPAGPSGVARATRIPAAAHIAQVRCEHCRNLVVSPRQL